MSAPAPGGWPARPGPAPGLAYASFVPRLIALVIDFVIVGIISGVLAAVIGLGFAGLYGGDWFRGPFPFSWNGFDLGRTWLIYAILQAVVSGIYFVGSWRSWNATPGQRIFELQVLNAADGAIRRQAFSLSGQRQVQDRGVRSARRSFPRRRCSL